MKLTDKIKTHDSKLTLRLPSVAHVQIFAEDLIDFLFPVRSKHRTDESQPELTLATINSDFSKMLNPVATQHNLDEKAITEDFFNELENVFDLLCEDAAATLEFDPAAFSLEEVINAYPGFYAVAIYRISNILYKLNVPLIPRILSEHAHSKTGIDIHPGATIGRKFFIDHGTGIVIGETTEIGERVKIYQGVTLGALQVSKTESNRKRHPTIEDNVVIYSGATILGGKTVIGHDSVIGGNVWITSSIDSFSLVFATNEVKVRTKKDFEEPINFVI